MCNGDAASLRVAADGSALRLLFPGSSMDEFVAMGAQRDQVLFHIAPRLTPEFLMVHMQVPHAAAGLASPAIALQHLPMQYAVARRVKPESRGFAVDALLHDAFPVTLERKASRCGLGKKL